MSHSHIPSNKPVLTSLRNPIHPSVIEKLDPAFIKLYNDFVANGHPPTLDLHLLRQNLSASYSYATAPATGVGGIGETQVPGWEKYPGDVNVRVYVPPGEDSGVRRVWPVHFNFHGGGWAAGDLETGAHICHHICASVPCCVIDVEYRLIPEYPFPIGVLDSMAAVEHVLQHHNTFSIDPSNFSLGGESTGATIALILNHLFRDRGYGGRLKGVIAGTPWIGDLRKYAVPGESPWASIREFEHAPLLDWKRLKWLDTFKWMSLSGGRMTEDMKEAYHTCSWHLNILDAPEFHDLAPMTWIGTAEVDPTRDEAEAYGKRMREAGNHVIVRRFPGVPHPFMHMDKVLRQGREYVQDVIAHVRLCLYPPVPPTPPDSLQNGMDGHPT